MKSTFASVVAACLVGITGLHSANFAIAEQPSGSPDIVLILAE